MATMTAEATLAPNMEFAALAGEEQIARTAQALEAHGIHTLIAEDGQEAKRLFFELVPDGAEVFLGSSITLEKLGIKDEVDNSGRYIALRPKMFAMDRKTQGREIRKISAAPDVMLGSVQAVTRGGALLAASYSGSQLGPYAMGAGRVILVVGSQKIVPDLDTAIRRIRETVMPYEDERLRAQMGRGTHLAKLLVTFMEPMPGRTTVILVREPVGV
jgi:hypothetical protein